MSATRSAHHVALEESLHGILSLGSDAEAATFLDNMIERFEMRYCAYHVRSLPGSDAVDPLVVSNYPGEWLQHYIARNYVEIDPVVHESERSILPIDWGQLNRRPASVRQMFGEAGEFGVGHQGLTVCMRGPNNDRALFSVSSLMSTRDWIAVRPELTQELQVLAHHFHAKMMALHTPASATPMALTSRERQCLRMSAEGYLTKEIARALAISPPAVRAYLDSARHKLGTVNKTHAVAKALRLSLI
jgi:DNA-binding CsgD family transcriptional regulator